MNSDFFDDEDDEVLGGFVLTKTHRWVTSANENTSIIAEQISHIFVKTKQNKGSIKYLLCASIVLTPSIEKTVILASYQKRRNAILEKRRLLDWIHKDDDTKNEFRCYPEYPKMSKIAITSKTFK